MALVLRCAAGTSNRAHSAGASVARMAWLVVVVAVLCGGLAGPVVAQGNETGEAPGPTAAESGSTAQNATSGGDEGGVDLRDLSPPKASTLVALGFVFLATLVLGVGLWGLAKIRGGVSARVNRWKLGAFGEIHIGKVHIKSRHWVRQGMLAVVRVAHLVLIGVFLFAYVLFTLREIPGTRSTYEAIRDFLLGTASSFVSAFIAYLPDLGYVILLVAATWIPLRILHAFFEALAHKRIVIPGFYRSWARPTYKIVRFLVFVFAFILIFPHLPGSGTTAFQGVSIFLGALISLGASSAIANAVAGTVLTYTRAFERGDRVQIADTVGDVVERTLFVTRVRTIKNVVVTVPNALVLQSHITNFSRLSGQGGIILHTQVGIGYEVPWREVHELLLGAASGVENVLETPGPFVHQTKLGDFAIQYELNVYTENPAKTASIMSDLHERIQDAFAKAGVEIMTPHYRSMRDGNKSTAPSPPHATVASKPTQEQAEVVLADADALKRADEQASSRSD